TGSMGSTWLCLLCLASSGLILLGTTEPVLGLPPAESLPGQSHEQTELVRSWEKWAAGRWSCWEMELLGALLQCQPWKSCAVRRGARIGKLCSCPQGTSCNFYILKCS
ncbi:CART protein, partial [Bucco capensis]|nr:CART protein [Bucco capensis]